jgi:hypothetical protein
VCCFSHASSAPQAEDGYAGVEVRVTPMRTEIIIRATRTQNVLGACSSRGAKAADRSRRADCSAQRVPHTPFSAPPQHDPCLGAPGATPLRRRGAAAAPGATPAFAIRV